MKDLFNNLVKIGNQNPELRDDVAPILHHLKDQGKSANSEAYGGPPSIAAQNLYEYMGAEMGKFLERQPLVENVKLAGRGRPVFEVTMNIGKPHGIDEKVTVKVKPEIDTGKRSSKRASDVFNPFQDFDPRKAKKIIEKQGVSVRDFEKKS
jgi:hypothetical protein